MQKYVVYEKIKNYAESHWGERCSFAQLAKILGLDDARQAASQVQHAWNHFDKNQDSKACAAISKCYWPQKDC